MCTAAEVDLDILDDFKSLEISNVNERVPLPEKSHPNEDRTESQHHIIVRFVRKTSIDHKDKLHDSIDHSYTVIRRPGKPTRYYFPG